MMHPFLECCVEDLNRSRTQTLDLLNGLDDPVWQRRIPGGAWTIRDLAAHTLSDRWALASLSRLFDDPSLVTSPWAGRASTLDPVTANARIQHDDKDLSLSQIFARGFHEREMLLTALASCGNAEAEWLYRHGDNLTGYHDRMHHYDFRRALEVNYYPIPDHLLKHEIIRTYRAQTEVFLWAFHTTDWGSVDPESLQQLDLMIDSPLIVHLRDIRPDLMPGPLDQLDDSDQLARTRESGFDVLVALLSDGRIIETVAVELRELLEEERDLWMPLEPHFLVHRWARQTGLSTGGS
jgi:hypothetical protein